MLVCCNCLLWIISRSGCGAARAVRAERAGARVEDGRSFCACSCHALKKNRRCDAPGGSLPPFFEIGHAERSCRGDRPGDGPRHPGWPGLPRAQPATTRHPIFLEHTPTSQNPRARWLQPWVWCPAIASPPISKVAQTHSAKLLSIVAMCSGRVFKATALLLACLVGGFEGFGACWVRRVAGFWRLVPLDTGTRLGWESRVRSERAHARRG